MSKKKSTYAEFLKWSNSHGDVTTKEEELFYNSLPDSLKSQCVRQKKIMENGRIYYLDFYFFFAHLCVEIDGGSHLSPNRRMKDKKRDAFMLSKGIKTIRFYNSQITDKAQLDNIIKYLVKNYT